MMSDRYKVCLAKFCHNVLASFYKHVFDHLHVKTDCREFQTRQTDCKYLWC